MPLALRTLAGALARRGGVVCRYGISAEARTARQRTRKQVAEFYYLGFNAPPHQVEPAERAQLLGKTW